MENEMERIRNEALEDIFKNRLSLESVIEYGKSLVESGDFEGYLEHREVVVALRPDDLLAYDDALSASLGVLRGTHE